MNELYTHTMINFLRQDKSNNSDQEEQGRSKLQKKLNNCKTRTCHCYYSCDKAKLNQDDEALV